MVKMLRNLLSEHDRLAAENAALKTDAALRAAELGEGETNAL